MTTSENPHVLGPTPVLDRPATLEDVARFAGVSRQTVSNAVNSPHLLRAETLARVASAVDRLDYRPNAAARAMRTGQAGVLAVRLGSGAGLERSRVATDGTGFLPAFAAAAGARGRVVVGFTAGDDAGEARRYTELVAGHGLDGVLVEHGGRPCAAAATDPRLQWLDSRRVRGVLLGPGDGRADGPHPRVDVDLAAGFEVATRRLIDLGHRRIALVGPGADDGSRPADGGGNGSPEHAGWAAAMTAAGLPTEGLAVPTGHDLVDVRSTMARLLARSTRPTAFVTTSELAAAVGHAEITAWGLTVGEDVVLVGVGNGVALEVLEIATIAVPMPVLAGACVDLLLRRAPAAADTDTDTPPAAPVVHLVPELVTRRSLDGPTDRGEL